MTKKCPQAHDAVVGSETASQQAMLMQLLEPLGVVDVGLATRDILDVARVDEKHLESARFEDLEDRNPVHARRFHGDGRDAGLCEPVGESMEIAREAPERADGFLRPIGRHGDDVERCTDVESRSSCVDGREGSSALCPALRSRHRAPPGCWVREEGRRKSITFLNGIAETASPLASPRPPPGHVFSRARTHQ